MTEKEAHAPAAEKEILRAAKSGALAQVRQLLEADPTLLHLRDKDGSTLLHHAAWKGHREIAAFLLDAGADVHAQNSNPHWGGSPLHAAAHGGQRAVVELLIGRGADLHARSCNGRTPLEESRLHNAASVEKLLKAHGVTV